MRMRKNEADRFVRNEHKQPAKKKVKDRVDGPWRHYRHSFDCGDDVSWNRTSRVESGVD